MDNILKNIAPEYDITKSYTTGEYCNYNNKPFICLENTSGVFDSDKWQRIYLSEMITGKLSQNIGYRAEEPVLLWENPSPTATFAAQTLAVDLSEYSGVIIEFRRMNTDDKFASRVYIKKSDSLADFGAGHNSATAQARNITAIDDAGITFGNGDNSGSADSRFMVPTKIYGIKEVIVETVPEDKPELLWTNASVTSSFAAQKVSVNLSDYEGAIVEFASSTGNTKVISRTYVRKSDTITYFGGGTAGSNTGFGRNITKVENDGITFSNAIEASSTNNGVCIPYHIYGVRKAVVEVESNAPDLLWVNGNPTSAFSAQTVSLNLSAYDGVIIEGKSDYQDIDGYGFRVYIKKGETKCGGRLNANNTSGASRKFTVNDSGIDISTAYLGNATYDTIAIPLKIYGIKGVITEITEGKDAIIEAVNDKGGELESTATTSDIVDAISNLGGLTIQDTSDYGSTFTQNTTYTVGKGKYYMLQYVTAGQIKTVTGSGIELVGSMNDYSGSVYGNTFIIKTTTDSISFSDRNWKYKEIIVS